MNIQTVRELPPGTELVEVLPSGVILLRDAPNLQELGTSGMTKYGNMYRDEYNATLAGRTGRLKFNQMRRSDGQIMGLLRLVKTPILAARWYVAPKGTRAKDKKIAQFVHENIFHMPSTSFWQVLAEALTMLEFGFAAHEKVWEYREWKGKRYVMLQKLAMRHAIDAEEFVYDSRGGPVGLKMWDPNRFDVGDLTIPIEKLLVFTNEKEGGDFQGVSILRPAYKHWYYKENLYKVDAIQKERHGIGIPLIKLPAGFSTTDRNLADEIGRNLRTNEKAHVVLPPNWELTMLRLEGNLTNALESIEHHDRIIVRSVLGQFLNVDTLGEVESFLELFLKSTRFIADQTRDVFNKWLIPELVAWNFGELPMNEYPELRVRRLGDTVDWRTISFAIRNFVGAGAMIPDETLEQWIREEMDLPPRDETTQRIVTDLDVMSGEEEDIDPELEAPRPGLPRQSQAGRMRKSPGSSSVGRDASGS